MPSLNISSPAISVLLPGLNPVAANPIGVIDAPNGNGNGNAFGLAIAGLPEGLMLDAPPAPGAGAVLPPARPDLAGPPQPLPVLEVEQIMVGAGAVPVVPLSPTPKESVPQPLPQETAAPVKVVPGEALPPPIVAAPIGNPDDPAAPVSPAPAPTLTPKTPFTAKQLPEPVGSPTLEDAKSEPNQQTLADDSPLAAEATAPVVTPPAPATPFSPIVWNTVPPLKPAAPAPVSGDVTTPEPMIAAATVAIANPLRTREPLANRAQDLPLTSQSKEAEADTIDPLQSTQPLPATAAKPAVVAAPLPAPQTGFALPPEIARQVAQIIASTTRDTAEPVETAAPSTSPASPAAVAQSVPTPTPPAFVPAQPGQIDTSRAEWLQAMIERIAEMPQANGKREAQIRLLPDALGAIEVKIEQRQDRMHVTLNADNAQTRQMLNDAAPRLHELAEARGLRLGQTGVGGGEQQDRRPAPEQSQNIENPLRPRGASASAHTDLQPTGDLIA